MPPVSVRLFGSFSIADESGLTAKFPPGKLQDLFCYLLINRDRELPRELIASTFWGNTTTSQSKKYLRILLWQLRTLLEASFGAAEALHVDAFFVRLKSGSHFWLDIAEFECINKLLVKTPVVCPTGETATRMKAAVVLYSGDLLPGNYCDWCPLKSKPRPTTFAHLRLVESMMLQLQKQVRSDLRALNQTFGLPRVRVNPGKRSA
jgi:DNA-binding SARP family transcriptional activator